jgi:hypothetical protein
MPMQKAALWSLSVTLRRKHEQSFLPKTQDDTITKTLGEWWGYDVRRHNYKCKNVQSSRADFSG